MQPVSAAVVRVRLFVGLTVWSLLAWPGGLVVQAADARPTLGRSGGALLLLPPSTLARLRAEAAAQEARWREFQASLDRNLPVVLNEDGYQGSRLAWISDYALGYQILRERDPATAARYADKALAMMQSGLRDYQRGGWEARQFLARGDGLARSFALPRDDVLPASCKVFLANVKTQAVTRSHDAQADAVDYYRLFLKVSDTPDGPADYQAGVDWRRNGNLPNNLLDWSSAGRQPAPGATYYVTSTSGQGAKVAPHTLLRHQILLNTAPTPTQAVLLQCVYGPRAAGTALSYQQTSAGDGGFNSILVDGGYSGRYLGKHLALGLDWLDGYAGLMPELTAEALGLLVRWSDQLRDKGYRKGSPASNYEAGSYCSRVLTALALADRHPAGPRLVQELLTYRQQKLLPVLSGPAPSLRGGFWAEGWNYGPLAVQNLVLPGLALEQRGLIETATAERCWAGEVVRHLVSAQSSPDTIFDGGDWYVYPAKLPAKTLFSVLSAVASEPADRAYANYVLQRYPGRPQVDYLDLLYRHPAAPAAFWSELPLQHLAEGTGVLTARSDWGSTSTWVAVCLGNLLAADHQAYSPGQLQIRRGGDDLLINGNAPGAHQGHPSTKSTYGNLVLIDDGGAQAQVYRWGMGIWYGTPGIRLLAYQAEPDFVYLAGDYRAAYSTNRRPGDGGPAQELTRQVVYWRPNYVFVHDRVRTAKASYAKQQRWHFLRPPTVSENSFEALSGSSRLFGCTFASVPIATTVTAVKSGDATVQQLITQNTAPVAAVRYTTAFEVAAAGVPARAVTQQVTDEAGGLEGVQVGACVVLFGTTGLVDRQTVLRYQLHGSGTIRQLVVDLPPDQVYRLEVNGLAAGKFAASRQGVLAFTTERDGAQTIALRPVE